MDKSTIFSKTGKGVLEIKSKAGKLPKDLFKLLTLIDGKSVVGDLLAKSKFDEAEMNKALGDLTAGGYIKEFSNTSSSQAGAGQAGGGYVDDLDFTTSLAPGKSVYQNAQSEWRQRETADRDKAEKEAKRKRQEDEGLKKQQATRQARDESARMAKVEAERKIKEAAANKLREEGERKTKAEAADFSATQRDLAKILELERKKLDQKPAQSAVDAERLAREEAVRKVRDEEARRRSEEDEQRKRKEVEERKRREEEERSKREEAERWRRADEERKRKEVEERKRREEEERKKHEEAERQRKEEERRKREETERQRKEEEERKRKEEEERKRREEEERKLREEVERKLKEEEERRRKEDEERRKREAEERQRREEELRKLREEEELKRREAEEAERKRKEEEERLRLEAEVARRLRREEEDRRRKEEDERRRREDEEMRGGDGVAREEEDRRRVEEERIREEEDRRREDEAMRQREDAERRRREQEESRSRDEEDRRRREEAEARRREDEDWRRRENEANARAKEHEARTRADKKESAKIDLGQFDLSGLPGMKAPASKPELPPFDLSGSRATETQVAAEFEKQQEDLRKREQEEDRHREQEEQARMAMERAEREEQARMEAERREIEDQERRERMERERQDREQRERKRQEEKEARVREQEESKVQREQERQRQELMKVENERRAREDELAKRRKDQEERDRKRAEIDALKKQKGIKSPLDRLKPIVIGVAVLAAIVIGSVQLVPMNTYVPAIEKIATEHYGEPVTIGSMHVSILSGFTINLENVNVGATQDVKIDKVSLTPEFGSLFSDVIMIRKLEVESAKVAEQVLPRLQKWQNTAAGDRNVRIERVLIKSISLESQIAVVPSFSVDLRLSPESTIQQALLSSNDGKLSVEIVPNGTQFNIAVSASKGWVPPVGPKIEFADLTLKAVASRNQIKVESFEALLYDGAAKGSAIINWGGPWSISGELTSERINLEELMAVFTREAKSTGRLEAKMRYALSSPTLATLFDAAQIDATFGIKKGDLNGVDLVRALQSGGRGVTQGGATRFDEISGAMSLKDGRYEYRNLRLSSGLLSAAGGFSVSSGKDVNGRVSVDLSSQAAQKRGSFSINGELKAIVLQPN